MKRLTLAAILLASLSLFGCNSEDESTSTPTELEGTWLSICDASISDGYSSQIRMDVTKNEITLTSHIYNDSNCIIEETLFDPFILFAATYTLGESVITSSGLTARKIDTVSHSPFYTYYIITEYDIIRISEGKLYIGDSSGDHDGKSEANRPIDLMTEVHLTKVM